MPETVKRLSEYDANQIFQKTYNPEGGTIAVDGFLVGKAGRKVDVALSLTAFADDTETFTFSEDGTDLFTLVLIYTDGSRAQLLSAERTA
tara:strand:- start:3402 stop:3671 length:270 start_codon:yes stop_codon:yes gene_type:complete